MTAPLRRCLPWLLLSAMVLWQMLGVLHATLHLEGGRGAPAAAHVAAAAPATPAAGSWLVQLFAGHEQGSGDCRLLDHLSHADPIPAVAALSFPAVCPAGIAPSAAAAIAARTRLAFAARGPPFSA